MSATNRGAQRRASDFYPTPETAIEALLDNFPLGGGIKVLEPGAGSGNIIRALRRYDNITIDAVEIREEERETLAEIADNVLIGDYMSMELGKYDAIIGNPPFSNAMDFVTKSYQHLNPGGVIIFLLRTAFLESKERFQFWKEHAGELAGLYTLHQRPSFTGKGTDATSYSWFIWKPGSNQNTIKII